MKRITILLITFIWIGQAFALDNLQKRIDAIGEQLLKKEQLFAGRYPEYTQNGVWKFRKKVNWFSGFMAGELWQYFKISGDSVYYQRALKNSRLLLPFSGIDYTHDMGFIFIPSVVQSFKESGQAVYRHAGLQAAAMLARRFNKQGNFIRAWGKLGSTNKAGWMIIDTMMNLDLLFWAAQESGDYRYSDIAYRHALTTLKETVRPNASSYHVVVFDPQTGQALRKFTHQGVSDSSTWARGQAWGVYGFANAYHHTGDQRFLKAAQRMAEFMLDRLPADLVPYWDLDLSGPQVLRDASAGAILASGLYLLADQAQFKAPRERYLNYADRIVESLLQNYLYLNSKRKQEQGLLIHTVYNFHKNWGKDESYPAGDYYFMEALRKYYQRRQTLLVLKDADGRQTINWDRDWYYLQDSQNAVDQLSKSAGDWQHIHLPHTWNQFDATDNEPGYRRAASWYEKSLFVPQWFGKRRILLAFEGVNILCDVYVNGKRAGRHVGGYVGFEVDITDFVRTNALNKIQIRVDNSYDPDVIPSQKSDFFIYGGIPRDVWLKVVPEKRLGALRIKTPRVNSERAGIEINLNLTGIDDATGYGLEVNLKEQDGKVARRSIFPLKKFDPAAEISLPVVDLIQPHLWSPDQPYLYQAQARLLKGGKLVDERAEKFGVRWFEFKEHGPFYLNGKRLLLRGTHRHEEHAGYGAAMPNALHRQDMQQIKDMGANFVRLAHYPQDPEIYNACDSLGLLVWDELPWCRGGMGGAEWKANTRRLLSEQIKQNYNYPSIIIWSLGNELYWLPDFEGGASDDSLRAFIKQLNDLSHRLDPQRLTAIRKYYAGADIVDVFSPSIWAGWYSGVYKNYGQALDASRKKYPHSFHAEYGGSSHLGRHDENPVSGEGLSNPDGWEEASNQVKVKNVARSGDWSENYIVDLFDWHLHVSENSDRLSGNAQWAFKDFGTPLRPENAIPYINQKGLMDRAGHPKDAYYVFKSYWTQNPKFCYIESHTWTERMGPPDKKRNVCVFSNCGQVNLILNGVPMGIKDRNVKNYPAAGLNWDLLFSEGENQLIALGLARGKTVTRDTLNLNYHFSKFGKPDNFKLSYRRLKNGNYLIEAVLQDAQGRRVLDYNKRIYFSQDGDGRLLKNYGTSTRSDVIEMANGYAAIELVPVPGGRAVIEARNQDFKGSYLVVEE